MTTTNMSETNRAPHLQGVISERRGDIAVAMQSLCDALGHLASVRDALTESLTTLPPGHPNERLAVGFTQTCEHLTEAARTIPGECFAIMLCEQQIGGEEICRRVDTMINNSLIVHGVACHTVPA
jgi:hypothetical protein